MKSNSLLYFILAFAGIAPAWSQGVLTVNNPAQAAGEPNGMQFQGAAFAANDMVPLNRFEDDPWPANYRTRAGSNLGVVNARIEMSANRGDWSLGYFHRQDWLLRGSRDSIDAHVLDQNGQLTSQVRTFDLDYAIQGYAADGLRLAFSRELTRAQGDVLRWGAAVSLLRGLDVRKEQAQGNLISTVGSAALIGNRYLFDSQLNAVPASSSFNAFTPGPARDVSVGLGYALDLGLSWNFPNGASLDLAVNDLFGRIKWNRVPSIEQKIDGAFVGNTFNSGVAAIISGSNSYQALNLALKPKLSLSGAYPMGDIALRARVDGIDGLWFPQLGAEYGIAPNWRLGLDYETRFGSTQISLRHAKYFMSLSTDKLKLSESRALGFAAGLNFVF
jgi:hypothetical protein